ncbi:acyl-CoA-binding protein [Flavobacterium sp.]|uniref:acyl-CoA-binding protein n=1 Tax=Flavobacterium sp. TaxID=239 RepID=UPI003D0C70C2
MAEKELDIAFNEAFIKVSNMEQDSLPQDVMLRLYAYYKQASFGSMSPSNFGSLEVRDAFKINAWMQVSHLSSDESKKCYIELVNEIFSK